MDFKELVLNSLKEMEDSGKIKEIVDQQIEKTMKSVIDDLYGTYSPFSKNLKKEMTEKLQIDFSKLDIASYNHLLLGVMKSRLDTVVNEVAVTKASDQILELLSDTKREYKLSGLLEMLKEEIDEDDLPGYGESYEMSLHIEEMYKSYWVSFDSLSDVGASQCKYRMLINEAGVLCSVYMDSERYGSRKQTLDFDVEAVMTNLHGLELLLFKMYSSGSRVIVDEDHCETTIYYED